MSKFEKKLTEGSVAKQLIIFSTPMLIANIIQQIYSVADMMIVGQFTDTAGITGVHIGSQVTLLLTNMVFGLCVGGTALIGQYIGADDRKALKETISTLFTTLLILAAALTVIMIAVQKPLLTLIKTPLSSFEDASSYFLVTTIGTIFIFGYNALSAVMRGMGDSRSPMIFVGIACIANIGLDFLFVGAFGMRALGAAIATVISQALSMILCIVYLKKNDFIFDFKFKSFKVYKSRLKMLLKIGVPTSVQNVAVGISFIFLTAMANSINPPSEIEAAAVGVIAKFNGFAILPALAMSSSISAMSAHNFGAKDTGRAVKTMWIGMLIAVIISLLVFALSQLAPQWVVRAFQDDDALIEKGVEYLKVYAYDYLIAPLLFCFNGLFIAAGHTMFSFINGVIASLAIRIPAAYILGIVFKMGLSGVGLAAPLASLIALITAVLFFLSGRWKKQVIIHDELAFETLSEL